MREAFNTADWREGLIDRRKLASGVVARVLAQGEVHLETTLEEVKQALAYHTMNDRDRAIVRTTFKDIRVIVRRWGHLDENERSEFLQGRMPFSTVAKLARSRTV